MPKYYRPTTTDRTPSLTFDYNPLNAPSFFSRAEVDQVFSHYLPNLSLSYGPSESKLWWVGADELSSNYGHSKIFPGDKRLMRLNRDMITSEDLARSVYLHELIHCFGMSHLALRNAVMWTLSVAMDGRRIIPYITDLCGFAHFYGYSEVVTDPALYLRKGSKNHLWIYIPAIDVKGKIYTAFLKFGGVDGKPFWVIESSVSHDGCYITDPFDFTNIVQGKKNLILDNVQSNKGVFRLEFEMRAGRLYLESYSRL